MEGAVSVPRKLLRNQNEPAMNPDGGSGSGSGRNVPPSSSTSAKQVHFSEVVDEIYAAARHRGHSNEYYRDDLLSSSLYGEDAEMEFTELSSSSAASQPAAFDDIYSSSYDFGDTTLPALADEEFYHDFPGYDRYGDNFFRDAPAEDSTSISEDETEVGGWEIREVPPTARALDNGDDDDDDSVLHGKAAAAVPVVGVIAVLAGCLGIFGALARVTGVFGAVSNWMFPSSSSSPVNEDDVVGAVAMAKGGGTGGGSGGFGAIPYVTRVR